MDKTKAAQIIGILVAQDYEPTIKRNGDEFTITVVDKNGVLVNTLKTFQDNNAVTARARVIDLA